MSADNFYSHDDDDPVYKRKGHIVERYEIGADTYSRENAIIMWCLFVALGLTVSAVVWSLT
jgi:hypothetical protein